MLQEERQVKGGIENLLQSLNFPLRALRALANTKIQILYSSGENEDTTLTNVS